MLRDGQKKVYPKDISSLIQIQFVIDEHRLIRPKSRKPAEDEG